MAESPRNHDGSYRNHSPTAASPPPRINSPRYTNPQSPAHSQLFLPEELWFDKLPHPFDPWRGLSPLLVADLAAKTDFAASAYMRGLIDNNAENGLIPFNELNRVLDLGFKPLPWGDRGFLPSTLNQLGGAHAPI